MKKLFVGAFVIAAGLGATAALNHYQSLTLRAPQDAGAAGVASPAAGTAVEAGDAASANAVKAFTVTGANYLFSPSTLTVKKGDKVRITFKNIEGFHDFRIDNFNVATRRISAGDHDVVEFIADKAGSFEYYCSVGYHRISGMHGTLVVTE